jgi:hypothetical protein
MASDGLKWPSHSLDFFAFSFIGFSLFPYIDLALGLCGLGPGKDPYGTWASWARGPKGPTGPGPYRPYRAYRRYRAYEAL